MRTTWCSPMQVYPKYDSAIINIISLIIIENIFVCFMMKKLIMLLVLQPRIQEILLDNIISQFVVTSTKMTCGFIRNNKGKYFFYLFKMMTCEVHAPL